MSGQKIPVWAPVCVRLLQGPVYAEDPVWTLLSSWRSDVQNYFATIGVSVLVSDEDGYAFLSQPDDDADEAVVVPRLVKKYPLTPEVSLLCVLLREELDSFDASGNQSAVLKMRESEIKDRLAAFLKDKNDQLKFYNKLDTYLSQLVSLSFLRDVSDSTVGDPGSREFEVRRIIRAKINPEFLKQFKSRLQQENAHE
jgi:hypothetical protein